MFDERNPDAVMRPQTYTATIAAVAAAAVAAGALFAWHQAGNRDLTFTFDPPYPETNADGDPILAVFEGRIPCSLEGCEKMKVGIVFYGKSATGAPSTYWLGTVAVALGNERAVTTGTWTIGRGVQAYPDAPVYELDSAAPAELRWFWRVSDDILLPLDQDRTPKAGNSGWGTMLSRNAAPYGPRTYTH
jgi:hypothetical protein